MCTAFTMSSTNATPSLAEDMAGSGADLQAELQAELEKQAQLRQQHETLVADHTATMQELAARRGSARERVEQVRTTMLPVMRTHVVTQRWVWCQMVAAAAAEQQGSPAQRRRLQAQLTALEGQHRGLQVTRRELQQSLKDSQSRAAAAASKLEVCVCVCVCVRSRARWWHLALWRHWHGRSF